MNLRGSGSIPLPFVTIFLMVALDEGKSVSAYARAFGVKDRRVMSRYLGAIGERARNSGPGLGLVTVKQHPTHSRARVLLTAKGRSVAKAILQQMRRPVDERRPVQCENCKRWFLPQRSGAKTCSPRCRLALHRKRKAVAKAILQQMRRPADERRPVQCENCKQWFLPRRSHAKTCSPRCRLALHRKRKAQAVA